jgi:hypothetical protein
MIRKWRIGTDGGFMMGTITGGLTGMTITMIGSIDHITLGAKRSFGKEAHPLLLRKNRIWATE